MTAYDDEVAADSPARYWPLAGSLNDLSGNGDTLSLLSGTTTYVTDDQIGTVLDATASDYSHGFDCPQSAYTIEGWVKLAGTTTDQGVIVSDWFSTGAMLTMTSGVAKPRSYHAGVTLDAPSAISLLVWHHIAVTWDGSTRILYIDGASVNSTSTTAAPGVPATSNRNLNNYASGGTSRRTNGKLCRVAWYNTALSSTRIAAHHTAFLAAEPGYSGLIKNTPGLQHYYQCNETSGTTLADSKGSENLTLGGTYTLNATGMIAGSPKGAFDTTAGSSGVAYNASHTGVSGGNYSFEVWFKITASTSNVFMLSEGYSASTTPITSLDIQSTHLRAYYRGTSGGIQATGTTAINDGKVHHAVVVGDTTAGTLTVYLDGKTSSPEAQVSGYPDHSTTINHFAVGALYRSSLGNYAYGVYQHVAVYNTALSTDIIKQHYQAGIAAKTAFFM